MARMSSFAKWHDHSNGVNPTALMRDWLTDRGSLTYKLMAHSLQFKVQRLHQHRAICLPDEYAAISLPKSQLVQERDVLLFCDGRPVVLGHTVLPLAATTAEWPFFGTLGERSLGTTLFGDPLVVRGKLQYSRLYQGHPLVRRLCSAIGVTSLSKPLFARRSTFSRKGGVMLVTEVFFPEIEDLHEVLR